MKLPRFMLTQNQAAKTSDLFILHARKPAFIARVLQNNQLELIEVYQEDTSENIDKILSQMSEWYYNSQIKK